MKIFAATALIAAASALKIQDTASWEQAWLDEIGEGELGPVQLKWFLNDAGVCEPGKKCKDFEALNDLYQSMYGTGKGKWPVKVGGEDWVAFMSAAEVSDEDAMAALAFY